MVTGVWEGKFRILTSCLPLKIWPCGTEFWLIDAQKLAFSELLKKSQGFCLFFNNYWRACVCVYACVCVCEFVGTTCKSTSVTCVISVRCAAGDVLDGRERREQKRKKLRELLSQDNKLTVRKWVEWGITWLYHLLSTKPTLSSTSLSLFLSLSLSDPTLLSLSSLFSTIIPSFLFLLSFSSLILYFLFSFFLFLLSVFFFFFFSSTFFLFFPLRLALQNSPIAKG